MATFRLLKSETKPLTKELAAQFKAMAASPTERDLNASRLTYLKQRADAGQLINFNWAVARMDGRVMRVNGQHSSTMLAEANGSFPDGLFVHLDEYEVDGPEGLALLFRQFDARKSGRSAADVAGAYQNLWPQLHELPKQIGKIGIEGAAWYRRFVEGAPTPSGDEVYHLFNELALHPFLLWLGDIFSIKTPEMKRAQVVAAMYATFIASETEARRFWDAVARGGVEFEDTAPATVLDAWLKLAKEGKVELKPAEYYQGCIYGWNAFRQAKDIKDIKATHKSWLKPVE